MATAIPTESASVPEWEYSGVKLTLHNVIIPEDKLYPSPSSLDNLDEESEQALRFLGCELIQDAGILLKLPQVVMATAQVLYQRFYYSKSFVRCNYEHYSMACLFLAAKIEEYSRRLRDIINVYHHIRQIQEQKPFTPVILDAHYINLKNIVIKAERRVLKELGFCVHGKHPHKLIISYLQNLRQCDNYNLVQISWNYMNDCLRTDAFVRYYPETIACACIFLAARQLGIALPNNPGWWELYHVGEMSMRSISMQLLSMYAKPRPDVKALEARLAELLAESRATRQRPTQNSQQQAIDNESCTTSKATSTGAAGVGVNGSSSLTSALSSHSLNEVTKIKSKNIVDLEDMSSSTNTTTVNNTIVSTSTSKRTHSSSHDKIVKSSSTSSLGFHHHQHDRNSNINNTTSSSHSKQHHHKDRDFIVTESSTINQHPNDDNHNLDKNYHRKKSSRHGSDVPRHTSSKHSRSSHHRRHGHRSRSRSSSRHRRRDGSQQQQMQHHRNPRDVPQPPVLTTLSSGGGRKHVESSSSGSSRSPPNETRRPAAAISSSNNRRRHHHDNNAYTSSYKSHA